MGLTHGHVADLLISALQEANFDSLHDYDRGDRIRFTPCIDLAVILFPPGDAPVYGNVLLSRDQPQGHVAHIDEVTLAVRGVRWRRDRGEGGRWDQPQWCFEQTDDLIPALEGIDFISPYPASVLKLLVGVQILKGVDAGLLALDQAITHTVHRDGEEQTTTKPLRSWMEEMLRLSDDRATFALLKQLHDLQQIQTLEWDLDLPCEHRRHRQDQINLLNQGLADLGLTTLRIDRTRACDGSFYNRAGAGVGQIHMTAWDTARLLWLLDLTAPRPEWIAPTGQRVDDRFLSEELKRYLVADLIGEQGFHEVLSTTTICGLPGVQPGIPALLPHRWIQPDGSAILQDNDAIQTYSRNIGACQRSAEVTFAHKTGLTQNYGADAGIVKGISARGYRRHYIIAFFSNLGYRYSDLAQPADPPYASGLHRSIWYAQEIPKLAARIDRQIKRWVEG